MEGYTVKAAVYVEGELLDESYKHFDSEREARASYDGMGEQVAYALHRWITRDAAAASSPESCSYGDGTVMELSLYRGEGGAEGEGELVDRARATSEEVFARFGRTGGAWKAEVVLRDRDDEVVELADTFTVYPGGDWAGLAREALARCAREAAGRPGAVLAELYVTAYVEIDDDGGDGEGEIVLHETVEL